jgi:hypothetical protein
MSRLQAVAVEYRVGALVTLAARTGMRQGELLGLSWDDVDLEGARLTVRRAMVRAWDGGTELAAPKTRASQRTIPLSPAAVEALRREHREQKEARQAAGSAWQDVDRLVFTDAIGRPLYRTALHRGYHELLAAAGLPPVPFHGLRHSAATAWLSEGVALSHLRARHSRAAGDGPRGHGASRRGQVVKGDEAERLAANDWLERHKDELPPEESVEKVDFYITRGRIRFDDDDALPIVENVDGPDSDNVDDWGDGSPAQKLPWKPNRPDLRVLVTTLRAELTGADYRHFTLFRRGKTQVQIAKALGVTQGTVSKREEGVLKRATEIYDVLARAGGIPMLQEPFSRAQLGHRGRRRNNST